jgi:hypothetical protein
LSAHQDNDPQSREVRQQEQGRPQPELLTWLLTTHQSDLAPEVEDAMEQVEQKVAVDAQHSTIESPRVRISPFPRIDSKHPNRKTTNPQMRRHQ